MAKMGDYMNAGILYIPPKNAYKSAQSNKRKSKIGPNKIKYGNSQYIRIKINLFMFRLHL